jgi:hypothetical protein
MLRWSLVVGGLIALFWVIYYLIVGSVPTVTSIKMTETWTMSLPFGISRWWDIMFGPIWSIIIIYLLTKLKGKDDDLVAALVVGLGVSLIVGLVAGLTVGLGAGLGVSLIFGLAAGLGVSLIVGLGAGLGVSLTVGLGAGLIFGLVALIKLIWAKVGNWFMAKE